MSDNRSDLYKRLLDACVRKAHRPGAACHVTTAIICASIAARWGRWNQIRQSKLLQVAQQRQSYANAETPF